jgi:hypothetical protein
MVYLTLLTLLLPPSHFLLLADLKYEETTRITGGFLEGFSKMAGFFGAKGLNNTTTATYLKGDRLRTDNLEDGELTSSEIIQLDREEIITIDHKKKTYSVATFAERRAQMEKALEAMKGQSQKTRGASLRTRHRIRMSNSSRKSRSRTPEKPRSSTGLMPGTSF